jgi:hypothetical protein
VNFFEIVDTWGWPLATLVATAAALWSLRDRILDLFSHRQKAKEKAAEAERLQKEKEAERLHKEEEAERLHREREAELARSLREKEAEMRREFEQQVLDKTLQNGHKRDEWVKWLQVRYDTTVQALHMANRTSLDTHIATEKLTTQSIEMWQLNASILREQSHRLTTAIERLTSTLDEVRKTMAMLQFTGVKAYKEGGGNIDDIPTR